MDYGQLVTAIQDFAETRETLFLNHINDFIRATEDKVFMAIRGPVYWNTNTAQTFSASTPTYTAPDGTIDILDIHVHGPSASIPGQNLKRKDHAFLREAYPIRTGASTEGMPRFYAVTSASLNSGEPTLSFRVAPVPDATYGYTISWYGKATGTSITDGNSPTDSPLATTQTWLSVAYPDILLYGSLVQAGDFLMLESEVLESYRKGFQEGLLLFKNMSENRQDTDEASDLGKPESVA